jgi:hypothetical protein
MQFDRRPFSSPQQAPNRQARLVDPVVFHGVFSLWISGGQRGAKKPTQTVSGLRRPLSVVKEIHRFQLLIPVGADFLDENPRLSALGFYFSGGNRLVSGRIIPPNGRKRNRKDINHRVH